MREQIFLSLNLALKHLDISITISVFQKYFNSFIARPVFFPSIFCSSVVTGAPVDIPSILWRPLQAARASGSDQHFRGSWLPNLYIINLKESIPTSRKSLKGDFREIQGKFWGFLGEYQGDLANNQGLFGELNDTPNLYMM